MIQEEQITLGDIVDVKVIFKDKFVLKPNYVPENIADIKHRNEQIKAYYQFMKDIFLPKPMAPANLFIYGKPGLGKTLLTEFVMKEVLKLAEIRKIDLLIISVNCAEAETEHSVLQKIVEKFPTLNNEPKKKLGYSIGRHNDYIHYLVDNYTGIVLIVLDEVDKVDVSKTINRIIRMKSEKSGQFPTIIGITNDTTIKDTFAPELKSVICENSLHIPPYDAEQLIDILTLRAKQAFSPGTIEEMVIPLAAAFAAQEHGDARRAINLLRVGGEIAESEGASMFLEEHLRKANSKIDMDQTLEVIKTLPTQSKITLFATINILGRETTPDMNNIYNLYKVICKEIDLDILSQRRITDLIDEMSQLGIMEQEILSKGRHGRVKVILKVKSKDLVKETLLEDYRLKVLANTNIDTLISPFRRLLT
jgi:cell division control protein 6